VLFAAGIVVLTGRFVLFDRGDIGTDTGMKKMKGIDRELFEKVTTTLETKTAADTTVPVGIRDPFSPPLRPVTPPPAPEPEPAPEPPVETAPTESVQ